MSPEEIASHTLEHRIERRLDLIDRALPTQ
jgi:hypothetical protein